MLLTSTINRIYAKAIERGFDPNIRPMIIKDEWVEDAPRSGRPRKHTLENTEKVIAKVCKDRYGRAGKELTSIERAEKE